LGAAKAASSTRPTWTTRTTRSHSRVLELLWLIVTAISLLIYLILELLCAALVLLNVVKYPLAELLVPILIIKDSLTRIVVLHQLIVLRRPNKLHVSILTSNIYHFLLLLFSLFSFLHALNCFPSDAIAHRLTTSTKYWEWI